MKQLFAILDIPNCDMRLNFEANDDKSTIRGPLNAAYLGLALGLLFGFKLDYLLVIRGDSLCPLLFGVLLDEHEVILEVGVVELPEM